MPPLTIQSGPRKGELLGIGGSDAPIVAGLSPWSSPAELWAIRSGIIPRPERESAPMTWGKHLEEPLIRAYAEQTGRRVRRPKGAIQHPTIPFMYGHVDGLASGRRVVEVKTSRYDKGWGRPGRTPSRRSTTAKSSTTSPARTTRSQTSRSSSPARTSGSMRFPGTMSTSRRSSR